MGEVETIIMETLSVEVTCQLPVGKGRLVAAFAASSLSSWFLARDPGFFWSTLYIMIFTKDEPYLFTYVSPASGLVLYEKDSPSLIVMIVLLLVTFPGQL